MNVYIKLVYKGYDPMFETIFLRVQHLTCLRVGTVSEAVV